MESVYQAIIKEDWIQAEEIAVKNYTTAKNIFELRNLIPVQLKLNKYEECLFYSTMKFGEIMVRIMKTNIFGCNCQFRIR